MKKLLFILVLLSVGLGSCAQRNFAAKKLLLGGGFHCPNVGDSFQGGIVIRKFVNGDYGYVAGECRGIIMTEGDISTSAAWGCQGVHIVTGDGIGYGQITTNAILAGCSTIGIAARLCDEYDYNGYSDWFLPTYAEIQQAMLTCPSYFASGQYYWTTTVQTFNDDRAIKISTTTVTSEAKSVLLRVKAFRYF